MTTMTMTSAGTSPPLSAVRPAGLREGIDALYATGHWLYSRERYRDATAVFRAMLACAPTDERGWLALGAAHERLNQDEIALELYTAGWLVAGPAPRCALARARLLRALGRDEEATLALDDAEIAAVAAHDDEMATSIAAERVP